jgi:hypothetical protein
MSLAPNLEKPVSREVITLKIKKEVSNIFWQMFYNQKFIRRIWVNTVFSAILLGTIFADGYHFGCDYFDMPMKFGGLHPHFSCNLTSTNQNASKQSAWFPWQSRGIINDIYDHVNSDGSQSVRAMQSYYNNLPAQQIVIGCRVRTCVSRLTMYM